MGYNLDIFLCYYLDKSFYDKIYHKNNYHKSILSPKT